MKINQENEGNAIVSQFSIMEGLLEIRLQQQEIMYDTNKLPQCKSFQEFQNQFGEDFELAANNAQKSLKTLFDNLISLDNIVNKFSLEKNINNKASSENDDEEITSEEEDDEVEKAEIEGDEDNSEIEMSDQESGSENGGNDFHSSGEIDEQTSNEHDDGNYEIILKNRQIQINHLRNQILTDLSNKVNIFNQKPAKANFESFSIPIIKQIDQILEDKKRLIERTQIQRSSFRVLGKSEENMHESQSIKEASISDQNDVKVEDINRLEIKDCEIFDDSDFYHQLLVESTKRKTRSMKDMLAVSRQWAELGKLRKLKKFVDQKASKGRKTRYNVHKKLVNFMAPLPSSNLWLDNRSLFRQFKKKTEMVYSVNSLNQQEQKAMKLIGCLI